MIKRVVPMIHVANVRETVTWYETIGFEVVNTYGNESGGLSFAILSFGSSAVMFNQGGQASMNRRREVDLYVYTDDVDDLYHRLEGRVDVVESPHDTFYGMRELIIRDPNRFWITFGQTSVAELLMNAVQEGNAEVVQATLRRGGLKPESLAAALAAATSGKHKNAEIAEMLELAGAIAPPVVPAERLQSYVGRYASAQGFEINVTFQDGQLSASPVGQPPMNLMPIDETTFTPVDFDGYGTITFNMEAGETKSCFLKHGDSIVELTKRVPA